MVTLAAKKLVASTNASSTARLTSGRVIPIEATTNRIRTRE